MIVGSLAARAFAPFEFRHRVAGCYLLLPRETKIQPFVPSNLIPFGSSVLTTIFTPLAYRASV